VTGPLGECALPLADLTGDLLGCANGHRFLRSIAAGGTGSLRRVDVACGGVLMPTLTITTVKTARMALKGSSMTLGELAALVEQSVAAGIPDDATVSIEHQQTQGLTSASLFVTWTASVVPGSAA